MATGRILVALALATSPTCSHPPPAETTRPPPSAPIAAATPTATAIPTPPASAIPSAIPPLPSRERLTAPFRGTPAVGFVAVSARTPRDAGVLGAAARAVLALPGGADARGDRPVFVASFTKLWTAVAILRLVERKALSLETTVGEVLPSLAKRPWADSTVHELLTHTSRVPEFDEKSGYYGRRDVDFTKPALVLETYVPRDRTEKRGQFKYKNAEFAILGAILAERSGVAAEEALRLEVFGPARMAHAGLLVLRASAPADLDFAPLGGVRAQNLFTAGAGYASPTDLLAFFEALEDATLLEPASKATLFDGSPARGQGALGCWAAPFARSDAGTTLLVERPGSFGNVRLFSAFFPDEGRAVVAWSHEPLELGSAGARARGRTGIGYALARAALGD